VLPAGILEVMSISKRQKEKDRQESQRAKVLERERRRRERALRAPPSPGEDPDLEGIVPGPQPVQDEE
jgi:hypothetical protein